MDHEFHLSVTKALHPSEAPLKMKHARSVIIATHKYKGAKLFWAISTRQPLMEHRFTAWKFCHVLHKVLREGHENCVRHSQVHKTLILEVGKLWGHLQDGVGKCIESYTQLLVNKLDFHQKNMGIPGAITMDFNDIRTVTGDDLNNYFQLCVEIFDYLDCIIALQAVIFQAINTYRMSSMTPQGQCRLAPLVTLIQDSNPLYDLCVRVLFRLHEGISHDILSGHRSRFNDLFNKLKLFYETVRPLQYFSDIIQLPHLPEQAPNFSSVHDVGNYIAPVMHVYQEEEELPVVEESLLDLSNASENTAPIESPVANEDQVDEAQMMIANLQEELRVRQMHIEQLVNVTREMSNLRVKNEALESEMNLTKEMLRNTTLIKENLESKLKEMEELECEVKEGDEKYKQVEEKFDKIKTMYGKLREDHIQLLRLRNDDSKQLMAEKKKTEDLQTEINNLKAKVEDYSNQNEEQNSNWQSKLKEQEDLVSKKDVQVQELKSELERIKSLFEKHDVDKNAMITEYENQLLEHKMELKKLRENYDLEVKTKQHEMNDLLQVKLNTESNLLMAKQESEALSCKINEVEQQLLQKTQTHEEEIKEKESQIEELRQESASHERFIKILQEKLEIGNKTNASLNSKVQEIVEQMHQINSQLERANQEIVNTKKLETQTKARLDELVSTLTKLLTNNMNKQFTFDYFEVMTIPDISEKNIKEIQTLLERTQNEYKMAKQNNGSALTTNFIINYLEITQCLKVFHEHIMLIFSNTTDLNKAEELRAICNDLRQSLLKLYQMFEENQDPLTIENICRQDLYPKLNTIQTLIRSLQNSFSESLNVGDMLQQELKDMDNIIEEATKQILDLLLNTKSQHEGIKLEVNEKILDSCTNLMKCIVVLIQRSRELQNEIVSCEKGSFTTKEFYKRNSQWTEGLISASKAIAKGAKYLVDAANKTIVSDSAECFELIVAAQDIAASTASLVIASKVKARNDSPKLANLTKASRDVSVATGQVVANVRDGNSKLEYKNEIDVSQLTPSQKKTMEMEMQIKVLQLEHSLQSEQQKLMSFRKAFYQSADED